MQIKLLIKLKGWMTYIEQCGKEVPRDNMMFRIMCLANQASTVHLGSDKAKLPLWVKCWKSRDRKLCGEQAFPSRCVLT